MSERQSDSPRLAARADADSDARDPRPKRGMLNRYGFFWITGGFFIVTLAGHWIFGWFAFASDQAAHGLAPEMGDFAIQMARDTLENWQSEFLQLVWQVGGLAILLHVGSPQSKEGDDRMEAKLDAVLRAVDRDADRLIDEIDEDYLGRHTDHRYVRQHQSARKL